MNTLLKVQAAINIGAPVEFIKKLMEFHQMELHCSELSEDEKVRVYMEYFNSELQEAHMLKMKLGVEAQVKAEAAKIEQALQIVNLLRDNVFIKREDYKDAQELIISSLA